MINRHITKILDRTAYAELSEQDRKIVSLHISDCADCRRAFEAAQLSSVLLKTNALNETAKPSPFFQAKVMNRWREQQLLQRRPIQAFRRWWQASAAPVFMMLVTVAVLVSLTVFAPQDADDSPVEVSSFNLYSTDSVVLNQKPTGDLTNEQVFQFVYGARNGGNSRK